jgi:uncharacterized protein (TIGR02271 family)
MDATQTVNVTTTDGLRGTIDTGHWPLDGSRGQVLLRLEDGRELMTSPSALLPQPDGTYRLTLEGATLQRLEAALEQAGGKQAVIPLVEERLLVGKRAVETGRVVISKRVVEEQQTFEQPLTVEEVTVERVPVERFVDGPVAQREEGDTLIIPVLEEVLVIEKRLMLREEVRVTRHVRERREPQAATVRREEVEVRRISGDVDKAAGTGVA